MTAAIEASVPRPLFTTNFENADVLESRNLTTGMDIVSQLEVNSNESDTCSTEQFTSSPTLGNGQCLGDIIFASAVKNVPTECMMNATLAFKHPAVEPVHWNTRAIHRRRVGTTGHMPSSHIGSRSQYTIKEFQTLRINSLTMTSEHVLQPKENIDRSRLAYSLQGGNETETDASGDFQNSGLGCDITDALATAEAGSYGTGPLQTRGASEAFVIDEGFQDHVGRQNKNSTKEDGKEVRENGKSGKVRRQNKSHQASSCGTTDTIVTELPKNGAAKLGQRGDDLWEAEPTPAASGQDLERQQVDRSAEMGAWHANNPSSSTVVQAPSKPLLYSQTYEQRDTTSSGSGAPRTLVQGVSGENRLPEAPFAIGEVVEDGESSGAIERTSATGVTDLELADPLQLEARQPYRPDFTGAEAGDPCQEKHSEAKVGDNLDQQKNRTRTDSSSDAQVVKVKTAHLSVASVPATISTSSSTPVSGTSVFTAIWDSENEDSGATTVAPRVPVKSSTTIEGKQGAQRTSRLHRSKSTGAAGVPHTTISEELIRSKSVMVAPSRNLYPSWKSDQRYARMRLSDHCGDEVDPFQKPVCSGQSLHQETRNNFLPVARLLAPSLHALPRGTCVDVAKVARCRTARCHELDGGNGQPEAERSTLSQAGSEPQTPRGVPNSFLYTAVLGQPLTVGSYISQRQLVRVETGAMDADKKGQKNVNSPKMKLTSNYGKSPDDAGDLYGSHTDAFMDDEAAEAPTRGDRRHVLGGPRIRIPLQSEQFHEEPSLRAIEKKSPREARGASTVYRTKSAGHIVELPELPARRRVGQVPLARGSSLEVGRAAHEDTFEAAERMTWNSVSPRLPMQPRCHSPMSDNHSIQSNLSAKTQETATRLLIRLQTEPVPARRQEEMRDLQWQVATLTLQNSMDRQARKSPKRGAYQISKSANYPATTSLTAYRSIQSPRRLNADGAATQAFMPWEEHAGHGSASDQWKTNGVAEDNYWVEAQLDRKPGQHGRQLTRVSNIVQRSMTWQEQPIAKYQSAGHGYGGHTAFSTVEDFEDTRGKLRSPRTSSGEWLSNRSVQGSGRAVSPARSERTYASHQKERQKFVENDRQITSQKSLSRRVQEMRAGVDARSIQQQARPVAGKSSKQGSKEGSRKHGGSGPAVNKVERGSSERTFPSKRLLVDKEKVHDARSQLVIKPSEYEEMSTTAFDSGTGWQPHKKPLKSALKSPKNPPASGSGFTTELEDPVFPKASQHEAAPVFQNKISLWNFNAPPARTPRQFFKSGKKEDQRQKMREQTSGRDMLTTTMRQISQSEPSGMAKTDDPINTEGQAGGVHRMKSILLGLWPWRRGAKASGSVKPSPLAK